MNIDWSKAPEGATHFSPPFEDYVGLWARTDGKTWMYKSLNGSDNWYVGPNPAAKEEYLPRPAPWTGEGLPPVGTVCEYQTWVNREWKRTKVLAHHLGFAVHSWAIDSEEVEVDAAPPQDFRLICSTEQIAVDEMREIISSKVGDEDAAKALYLAGYRKVAS